MAEFCYYVNLRHFVVKNSAENNIYDFEVNDTGTVVVIVVT